MRTNSIVGVLGSDELPEVGENAIVMNDKPLDNKNANVRAFSTSLIESYEDTDLGRKLTTETGSVYLIEEV